MRAFAPAASGSEPGFALLRPVTAGPTRLYASHAVFFASATCWGFGPAGAAVVVVFDELDAVSNGPRSSTHRPTPSAASAMTMASAVSTLSSLWPPVELRSSGA